MKTLLTVTLIIFVVAQGLSQSAPSVVNQNGIVSLTPLYQRWSSEGTEIFSEASSALTWYQPLSREASFSLRGSFASTSGNTPSLSSLNDLQLSGKYYIEDADLVFGLGLNIPTGKKKLTLEEFGTSYLVSNSVFRLQVPHYGTGFNASPSATLAYAFSEEIVGGVGALFQYRGKFVPIEEIGDYDPGDEISFTGGMDFRLDPTTSLSFDVVFSLYGKDKLDNVEVFSAGNKLLTALQYSQSFDFDELLIRAIVRTRSGVEVPPLLRTLPTRERVEPNQFEFLSSYKARFSEEFSMTFSAGGRFSDQTLADFSGMKLVALGVAPEFTISDNVLLPVRVKYTFGKVMGGKIMGGISLNGIEAGVGVVVTY